MRPFRLAQSAPTKAIAHQAMALLCAVGVVGSSGCAEAEVFGVGEFGRPIDLITDDSDLPRLLTQGQLDACGVPAGPCESLCSDSAPGNCPADACMSVLIDSASPFTVLPAESYALGDECVAVRQGHAETETGTALSQSVTRFRFDPVPTVRAPSIKAGPWEWTAGSGPTLEGQQGRRLQVGAVIGGNLLRHFAVRLTHASGPRTVTFYKQFPGTERGLADLGFAFVRLQYPGRLLGTRVNDRCSFGEGVACDLDLLQLSSFQGDNNFEETMMMLDACIAPPPCAPLWEVEDGTGRRSCSLRPGRAATLADAGRECSEADEELNGGRGASLIVATGVDGMVLFEDSATRMFGDLVDLPGCDTGDTLAPEARACIVDEASDLYMTGYGRVSGLRRIRVRSLALMAGATQASSTGPCTRLRRRLNGAELQCRGLDQFDQPHAPDNSTEFIRDDHGVVLGETRWAFGQTTPNPQTWLLATVLPADSTITMSLRRQAGTNAVEPDGLLGSSLLQNTDVVLDYTEASESVGVRVACTRRNASTCSAYPACSEASGSNEGDPARESCCWGMPANLVEDALTRPGNDAEPCCPTLTAEALARVQSFGACIGVQAPAGIGGITP